MQKLQGGRGELGNRNPMVKHRGSRELANKSGRRAERQKFGLIALALGQFGRFLLAIVGLVWGETEVRPIPAATPEF